MPSNSRQSDEREQPLDESTTPKGKGGPESLPQTGDIDRNAPTIPPRHLTGGTPEQSVATPDPPSSSADPPALTTDYSAPRGSGTWPPTIAPWMTSFSSQTCFQTIGLTR